MSLESTTAVVYGAGGRVGGAIAKGLAAEGARCFLVGRDHGRLDGVAAGIRAAGGRAETAVVDVLDAAALNDHADAAVERAGRIDVSVNVVAPDCSPGPLIDVPVPAFVHTVGSGITSQLLTTRAAARHMIKQGYGLILFSGGPDDRHRRAGPGLVGTAAVEALCRQWAAELGPYGVRVVSLLAGSRAGIGRAAASVASEWTRPSTAVPETPGPRGR